MNKKTIWITGTLTALLVGCLIAGAGSYGGATWQGLPIFALAALLALAVQWLLFVPAFVYQTERYFDLAGSLTYISLSVLICLLVGAGNERTLLIGTLVVVWAIRLGSFLFNRVSVAGEDRRFRSIKPDFLQFFMTWTLQALWVTVTFAAGMAAMTSSHIEPLGLFAAIGLLMWLAGFTVEVIADRQKSEFKARNPDAYINVGLWAWCRHPNYAGEMLLWAGITVIALPVLHGWQYATLISPFFVFVLLTQISGIRMLQARADRRWGEDPGYQAYKARTPLLIPRPPHPPGSA